MKQLLTLFILFLLAPSLVSAQTFLPFRQQLLLEADGSHYRLRLPERPWQLLTNTGVIDQFRLEGMFFVVARNENVERVLMSTDGIEYQVLMETETQLRYRVFDSLALLFDGQRAIIATTDSTIELVLPVGILPEQFIVIGDELLYWRIIGSEWQLLQPTQLWRVVQTRQCQQGSVIDGPIALLSCDETLSQIVSSELVMPIFLGSHHLLSDNQDVAIYRVDDDKYLVITPQTVEEVALDVPIAVSSVQLIKKRIFLHLANQVVGELRLSPAPLFEELPGTGGLVELANSEAVYRLGQRSYYSPGPSIWHLVSTPALFATARLTSAGVIAWTPNAADILFSTDGQSFSLRNGAWARSAKIKDVIDLRQDLFVVLRNSSGTTNLYRSISDGAWQRVTLPVQATYVLSIGEARRAAAGTKMRLKGAVTAVPGMVGDEIFYLEDPTGGIQVYLSKTRGALDIKMAESLEVYGEVSSSAVKRVLLESVHDVASALSSPVAPSNIALQQAATYLGRQVRIGGRVEKVSDGYFSLSQASSVVKSHWATAKNVMKIADEASMLAIIDWNAASEAVEAWVLEDPVIKREVPIGVAAPVAVAPPAKQRTQIAKSKEVKAQSVAAVVAGSSKKLPLITEMSNTKEVASERIPSEFLALFVGLATLLAVRGSRMRYFRS